MFFQNLAELVSKDAGSFLDVSASNGAFDIFQSARDNISSSLYNAGIAGVVTRQAYKLYQGISSLVSSSSSSPTSPLGSPFLIDSNSNNKKPADVSKMRKEWSQGSTKRLENFLRIGASSYSCHLGSNVREYFKKVFEPVQTGTTAATATTGASREEKIAKIINQAKSRLSGLVVISVIQSYLFTIEIVLSTIVHPIALYELHSIRIQFEEERRKAILALQQQERERFSAFDAAGALTTFNNNNNNNQSQLQSSSSPLFGSPESMMMMMQQQQNNENNGGWLSKAINVALKASIGEAPPPELLQPPPNLILRSAMPGNIPSAKAENGNKNSSNNNDDEEEEDEDDDDDISNKSSNHKKTLNVVLLQLIRALKQETETFIQQELGKAANQIIPNQEQGKSAFENPLNRISVSRLEHVLLQAVKNPALYSIFSCSALEWMVDFAFGSNDNFSNYTHLGRNSSNNNNTNAAAAGVDPVVYRIYYRYLNQVVCSDSFVKLTKKSSEIIFEKIALPELHLAWKSCKSFKSGNEDDKDTAKETESNSASSSSSSVQVIHIGTALISCVYKVAETELTKILLPELFLEENTEEQPDTDAAAATAVTTTREGNGEDGGNNTNNEDSEAAQERKLKERQMKMARKFPSFGDLSSFGGLCMQFARFTIESNVGGESLPEL